MENNFLNFKKKSEAETELYVYGNIEQKKEGKRKRNRL